MFRSIFLTTFAAAAINLAATPAHALVNRAWVSSHGTDASGCGAPATPCRTFQYVHDFIIAANGEIDVLDPAGFGPITISKSLSIVNDGVGTAGVQQTNASPNAITIAAGATDTIHLRGLNIDGLGVATSGVVINSAGTVEIVNCVVRHFIGPAIWAQPASGTLKLFISDTLASKSKTSIGISISPSGSASVTGLVKRVALNDNAVGLLATGVSTSGRIDMTVVDSTASGNAQSSFGAYAPVATANTTLMLEHVAATLSDIGAIALNLAIIRISRSTFTRNGAGIQFQTGGIVESFGDNIIRDNGIELNGGSLTPVALQ